MSTYTKTGEWELDRAAPLREDGGKRPTGTPNEASVGYTWMRDRFVISLYRLCSGLVTVNLTAGQLQQGSAIQFTGGSVTKVFGGSLSDEWFVCVANPMTQEVRGSDMWREGIEWEHVGEWEEDRNYTLIE